MAGQQVSSQSLRAHGAPEWPRSYLASASPRGSCAGHPSLGARSAHSSEGVAGLQPRERFSGPSDVRCTSPVSGLVQLSATTFSWGVTSCARRFHHAAALPLGGLPCYGPCSCGSRLFTLARSTGPTVRLTTFICAETHCSFSHSGLVLSSAQGSLSCGTSTCLRTRAALLVMPAVLKAMPNVRGRNGGVSAHQRRWTRCRERVRQSGAWQAVALAARQTAGY